MFYLTPDQRHSLVQYLSNNASDQELMDFTEDVISARGQNARFLSEILPSLSNSVSVENTTNSTKVVSSKSLLGSTFPKTIIPIPASNVAPVPPGNVHKRLNKDIVTTIFEILDTRGKCQDVFIAKETQLELEVVQDYLKTLFDRKVLTYDGVNFDYIKKD